MWKVKLKKKSSSAKGDLRLKITPPANAPIGEYILTVSHRGEETLLAMPVVLFNPWCPGKSVRRFHSSYVKKIQKKKFRFLTFDLRHCSSVCKDDTVFLPDEEKRQEYVMNEQGIIYKGSGNYITPMDWNFGQVPQTGLVLKGSGN